MRGAKALLRHGTMLAIVLCASASLGPCALSAQSLSKQKKAAQASGAKNFVTLSNDGTNG